MTSSLRKKRRTIVWNKLNRAHGIMARQTKTRELARRKRNKEPILSGGTPTVAQSAPCSPIARDSGALAAANARLVALLVAGRGVGVLHLHDVHGHFFRRAHALGVRTHSALDVPVAASRPTRTHPSHHSQVRALHGIFCLFSAALPRRARQPQWVALDVGHRGALLRRGIFGAG